MNCALSIRAGVTIRKQEQRRAKTLSAPAEKVAGDLADRLKRGSALAGEFLFDQNEVVADKVENFLDGQKRDGVPPDLVTKLGRSCRAEPRAGS